MRAKAFRNLHIKFAGASAFFLLALITLSVIWNQSIKNELASQSTKFIRRSLVSADMRGVVQAMNAVQFDSFDSVTFYNLTGSRVITLPPSTAHDGYSRMSGLEKIIYGASMNPIYFDDEKRLPLGTLSFVYHRFGLAHYAFGIWLAVFALMVVFLKSAEKKIRNDMQVQLGVARVKVLAELAKKIRHDIRSPLAVLKTIAEERVDLTKYITHIRSAVNRIDEVVSEIDNQKKGHQPIDKVGSVWALRPVIDQVVAEKQVLYPNINFDVSWAETMPIFSGVDSARLKATASNILENAVQACATKGQIQIRIQATEDLISIRFRDNGKGIPPEHIPRLFTEGFTVDKAGGSGLGLYFAKKLMNENGGNIHCESKLGKGTTISLFFPRRPAPSWYVSRLDLQEFNSVVIIEDQEPISAFWKNRMRHMGFQGEIRCSTDSQNVARREATLYLIDYDLGPNQPTGLDIIEKLDLGRRAILVTGHGDDRFVQRRSMSLGCGLIHKDEFHRLLS